MNIDMDRHQWTSGSHCNDLKSYGENLYLSVFICVHLWQKILQINFTSQKNEPMTIMLTVYCHWGDFY